MKFSLSYTSNRGSKERWCEPERASRR